LAGETVPPITNGTNRQGELLMGIYNKRVRGSSEVLGVAAFAASGITGITFGIAQLLVQYL